jgi:hypothetical protein
VTADSTLSVPPAFYARPGGRRADWWTLLHPPYTAWHLSYVALGAGLAPTLNWVRLGGTVVAFFLAVGLAAHALDELHGRPLKTQISGRMLWGVATVSLCAAGAIGLAAVGTASSLLAPFVVAGVFLVPGYNLELFGGVLHNDVVFAAAWGGFPVVVGFLAQDPPLVRPATLGAAAATLAAIALSDGQRQLSAPARALRRRVSELTGTVTLADGTLRPIDRATVLAPLESALKALSWSMPLLATAVLLTRLS